MSTAGASVLGVGFLIPLIYFLWSLRYGKAAGNNPWNAKGLEWTTQSPPTTFHFDVTPTVTEEAYPYAKQEELSGVLVERSSPAISDLGGQSILFLSG
jgi:cytochrome c oxidase subunit 1